MENLVRFSWHVGKYENVSYYPQPGTVGEQHCALSGEGVLVEEVSGALGRWGPQGRASCHGVCGQVSHLWPRFLILRDESTDLVYESRFQI